MKPTEQIESLWSEALTIHFAPSMREKEPAVIVIAFMQSDKAAEGYNLLLDNFSNKETTVVLTVKSNSVLSFALVAKATADTVKLDNLQYNKQELDDFKLKHGKDIKFVLAVGILGQVPPALIATRDPFRPYVADGYIITE